MNSMPAPTHTPSLVDEFDSAFPFFFAGFAWPTDSSFIRALSLSVLTSSYLVIVNIAPNHSHPSLDAKNFASSCGISPTVSLSDLEKAAFWLVVELDTGWHNDCS
jgi:hypothetical protein